MNKLVKEALPEGMRSAADVTPQLQVYLAGTQSTELSDSAYTAHDERPVLPLVSPLRSLRSFCMLYRVPEDGDIASQSECSRRKQEHHLRTAYIRGTERAGICSLPVRFAPHARREQARKQW